jgi:hypothetical protein
VKAVIANGIVKGLTYRAGTKESDPAAIGRLIVEFDADEADAAEIAALISHGARVELETPQLSMWQPTSAKAEA